MSSGTSSSGSALPMAEHHLHRALQMGFSTRYDDRTGMGRFGVGAKLAGISVARRLEIWSRKKDTDPWLYTYIDLDEIHTGAMRLIPVPTEKSLPSDCADLIGQRGTLVNARHAAHSHNLFSAGGFMTERPLAIPSTASVLPECSTSGRCSSR